MMRFLIFVLLGPPLGAMTVFWVLLPMLDWLAGGQPAFSPTLIFLAPLGYVFGLIPAMLVSGYDESLADRGVARRFVMTSLVGFGAAFISALGIALVVKVHSPFILALGLTGAIPAGACSLICSYGERRRIG